MTIFLFLHYVDRSQQLHTSSSFTQETSSCNQQGHQYEASTAAPPARAPDNASYNMTSNAVTRNIFPTSMTQSLGPDQLAQQLALSELSTAATAASSNVSDTMSMSYDSMHHQKRNGYSKQESFYLNHGPADKSRLTNGINDTQVRPSCLFENNDNSMELGKLCMIFIDIEMI